MRPLKAEEKAKDAQAIMTKMNADSFTIARKILMSFPSSANTASVSKNRRQTSIDETEKQI
jgi:hypothetical protein